MEHLLDLSPPDVEKLLKQSRNPNAKVNYEFLLAQRKIPQRGYMDKLDTTSLERESMKQKRCSTPAPTQDHIDPDTPDTQLSEDELNLSSGEEY